MSVPPGGRLPLPPALPSIPTDEEAHAGMVALLERGGLAAAYRSGAETTITRPRARDLAKQDRGA